MKKRVGILLTAVILCALCVWIAWENQALVRTDYTVIDENLPESFDGFRIVQISDLHNARFGKDNGQLLQLIAQAQPDMIAITGDMIDSRRTDLSVAVDFVRRAQDIAPCYYVTGNHEIRDEAFPLLEQVLTELEVTVLRGEFAPITRGDDTLWILGVDDYTGHADASGEEEQDDIMERMLHPLTAPGYQILLSHRPDSFQVFCRRNVNLVLAGHNHGGQFRIPGLGGVFASGEFFPEYDEGLFSQGETTMIVSRGLGNSLWPFRINNRPEVVVVTLQN